jgi:hypothetical protein
MKSIDINWAQLVSVHVSTSNRFIFSVLYILKRLQNHMFFYLIFLNLVALVAKTVWTFISSSPFLNTLHFGTRVGLWNKCPKYVNSFFVVLRNSSQKNIGLFWVNMWFNIWFKKHILKSINQSNSTRHFTWQMLQLKIF